MNDFDNINQPTRVCLSQFKRDHPKRNGRTVECVNVDYIRPGRWVSKAYLRCGGLNADWQKVTITLFSTNEHHADQLAETLRSL